MWTLLLCLLSLCCHRRCCCDCCCAGVQGNNGACEALVAILKMITTEDDTHASAAISASTNANAASSTSPFGFSFLSNAQSPLPFSVVPFSNGSLSASAMNGSSSDVAASSQQSAAAIAAADHRAAALSSERRSSFNPAAESRRGSFKLDDKVVPVFPFTAEESETLAKWLMWAIGNIIQLGKGAAMTIDESNVGKKGVVSAVLRTTTGVVWNSTRLGNAGAAEATLALLAKYSDNADIVQWSVRAVNNMCRSRTLSTQLLEKGAIPLIDSLLVKHHDVNSAEYWLRTAKETLHSRKESLASSTKDEISAKSSL